MPHPKIPTSEKATRYITLAALCQRWSTSKPTIYRHLKNCTIPQPIRFSSGMIRWDLKEIRSYEDQLRAQSLAASKQVTPPGPCDQASPESPFNTELKEKC